MIQLDLISTGSCVASVESPVLPHAGDRIRVCQTAGVVTTYVVHAVTLLAYSVGVTRAEVHVDALA